MQLLFFSGHRLHGPPRYGRHGRYENIFLNFTNKNPEKLPQKGCSHNKKNCIKENKLVLKGLMPRSRILHC